MGFICHKGLTTRFNFGTEIEGAYGKIANVLFDANQAVWRAQVVYYLNVASAERAKLITYCRYLVLNLEDRDSNSPLGYRPKPRPVEYTQEQWDLIINTAYNGLPNILFQYEYGVVPSEIGPVVLSKEAILGKVYEDFLAQCEPGSVSVLEDRPVTGTNGLLEELLFTLEN
jgi:hypothetical protein